VAVSKTIVELTISLDGFATGEGVDVEHPFGHSGQQLYAWHESTDPVDTRAAAAMMEGAGAFILGRTTLDVGIGTWGEDGAFGTECFVLTSRPHEPVTAARPRSRSSPTISVPRPPRRAQPPATRPSS
jgi:hypothetical protein